MIGALRGRKTFEEINRIQAAIERTEEVYQSTFNCLKPGMTEREVAETMHSLIDLNGLETAWDYDHCPTVNAGPESPVGHVGPTEIQVQHGHLVHFDFGIKQNDYCSDIQRVVYMLNDGEYEAPKEVKQAFDIVVKAIQKAVKMMEPGVAGLEIDQAARKVVTDAGFPEYKYATGHQLGRSAHDGGGILGPAWARYGDSPYRKLEAGQVYTVEPGLALPDYGYIGLEEDVLVTENGAEYLGTPQSNLILIKEDN